MSGLFPLVCPGGLVQLAPPVPVHFREPGKWTPVVTRAAAAHLCLSGEPDSPKTVRLLSHHDKHLRRKDLL